MKLVGLIAHGKDPFVISSHTHLSRASSLVKSTSQVSIELNIKKSSDSHYNNSDISTDEFNRKLCNENI